MTKPSIFDVHSESYRDTHDQHLPMGVKHDQFRAQKLEWVRSFIEKGTDFSLLDFGCNAGELCIDLSILEPRLKIFGVDEAQESIRVAIEKSTGLANIPTFFHSLNEISSSEKFDVISVFNVLHHVEIAQRESVLVQLKSRLKPNGKLLIWEHNRWNLLTRYLVKICPFDEGVVLVKAGWLKNTLQVNGLNLKSFEYVNVLPPSMQKKPGIGWVESFFSQVPVGAQYRLVATL